MSGQEKSMRSIDLTDDDKLLLTNLSTGKYNTYGLMAFFKNYFLDKRLFVVDDQRKKIKYYCDKSLDYNAEVTKLSRMINLVNFLKDENFVTLLPYCHVNEKYPSIIWLRSTTDYTYLGPDKYRISKDIVINGPEVIENGNVIMTGCELPTDYYEGIQQWYSYVDINPSFYEYIENGFKTPEECKGFFERIGRGVVSAIKAVFGHFF